MIVALQISNHQRMGSFPLTPLSLAQWQLLLVILVSTWLMVMQGEPANCLDGVEQTLRVVSVPLFGSVIMITTRSLIHTLE